jgi:16S rRNA (uracil1498-N3)-methyltransferase
MSARRLFVPAQRLQGARLVLAGDEHHHLARVLRARTGDVLTLFDGESQEIDAEVVSVGARETELALGARRAVPRQPRWEKIAREAARQCGRADVPLVDEPTGLEEALAAPELPARRFALWEGARGRSLAAALADAAPGPSATGLLVGPEGGFAAEEVATAERAGFSAVGLGPRILRVETAAVVAVALVQAAAGGLE